MLNCHGNYKQIARKCENTSLFKTEANANELGLEMIVDFYVTQIKVSI